MLNSVGERTPHCVLDVVLCDFYMFVGFASLDVDVVECLLCCLPTPMTLVVGGSTMFPLVASFSVHLASSAVTPAGSVHKSRGDNVVRMWVQFDVCRVCCYRGGIWCGVALCKYDLFVCSELGKGATSEAGKYLFRAASVWWRCAQYFVIASCG